MPLKAITEGIYIYIYIWFTEDSTLTILELNCWLARKPTGVCEMLYENEGPEEEDNPGTRG